MFVYFILTGCYDLFGQKASTQFWNTKRPLFRKVDLPLSISWQYPYLERRKTMRSFSQSILSCLLATSLIGTMAACSSDSGETGKTDTSSTTVNSTVASNWPTKEQNISFQYWVPFGSNAAASMESYDEHILYTTMEKKTNIHMNFIHPAAGNESTEFNLLLASDDLPDIIESNWMGVTGGPQNYIDSGIVISLDSLLQKYAPDAYQAMTQTENIKKLCTTDEGHFYSFVAVVNKSWKTANANTVDTVQSGPIIRADWLQKLGLKAPTTWDEWTKVLTAFRDRMKVKAPLTASGTKGDVSSAMVPWMGVYNTYPWYYQRDGKVVYGPMEDNYKTFLKAMHQWYTDGLLDPDFATNDANAQKSNMINGVSGAFYGLSGSGLQTYMTTVASTNPSYDLVAVEYPHMIDGKEPYFMPRAWEVRGGGMAAITKACKNPEYAAMYLNYFYTDDGMLLKNFGQKGVTWDYDAQGNLQKTELLTKNPDGLSSQQALAKYSRGDGPSPGYVLKTFDNTNLKPAQRNKEANDTWFKYEKNSLDVLISPAVAQTAEEAAEIGQYSANVTTYTSEMLVKFIMGTSDIDKEWDNYIAQLKSLGIDDVIKLKQAALDRYNK